MAELEIEHERRHREDPLAAKVGLAASVLAVLLGVVTIASHRTHTSAVVLKSEANDRWSYYQSKRIKYHNLELGEDLISLLAPKKEETEKIIQRYRAEKQRYERESSDVQEEARNKEKEVKVAEHRALRYDLGEGLLELALVMTSLYFISRKKLFPSIGISAGILGVVTAATGLLV